MWWDGNRTSAAGFVAISMDLGPLRFESVNCCTGRILIEGFTELPGLILPLDLAQLPERRMTM